MLYDENLKKDIFELYNVDKFFEIRIVSVDPKFRGQGVAKKLFTESEKLAKELGAKVTRHLTLSSFDLFTSKCFFSAFKS